MLTNQLSQHNSFDILCLQETWLVNGADVSMLEIDGYALLWQPASVSSHGGVAIYVKSPLPYTVRPESTTNSILEAMVIEVKHPLSHSPLIVCSIYRQPSTSVDDKDVFIDEFSNLLHLLEQTHKPIILTGDFNLDLLKHGTNDSITQYFNNILSFGYEPLITLPTRFATTSCSLIDHIFINCCNTFTSTTGILTSHISDHQLCFTCLSPNDGDRHVLQTPDNRTLITITKRPHNFHELIKRDLHSMNILTTMSTDPNTDPTENYKLLEDALTSLIHKYTKTQQVRPRKHRHKRNPWITQGLIKSIKHRDKLHLQMIKSIPNSAERIILKTNISTFNKILKKAIKEAKAIHYRNTFSKHKNNPKETWKEINNILHRKTRTDTEITALNVGNTKVTSPTDIANHLNTFFTHIGQNTADSIPNTNIDHRSFLSRTNAPPFNFHAISSTEIDSIIRNLRSKQSTGHDNISTTLIKTLRQELTDPVTLIANQMLSTAIFPCSLKTAKVKPLHKKGDKQIMNNYRPISLLPSISKILEKVILQQLSQHFTTHQLLFDNQYGFRKNRSTEHALIELTDRILSNMDNNITPTAIFLDLSKAFDSLNHEILLQKLSHYGLQNKSLDLCTNYLRNRQQYIQLKDTNSEIQNVNIGVPQGSILGPFFFLIYVNDLPNSSKFLKFITYADDTTLLSTINPTINNTTVLNQELNNVYTWLCTNKLSLNITKTRTMTFHTSRRQLTPPALHINNIPIQNTDTFNFLGITLDKEMNWKPHINKITTRISQACGALNRLKNILPQHIKLQIYNSLIQPYLRYGILAWGYSSHINKVFRLQKRCIRSIVAVKYNAHTDPIFKRLNVLKVEDLRRLNEFCFYYNFVNGRLPEYFDSFISFGHHGLLGRSGHRLLVPAHRRGFFQSSLRCSIVSTINSCPTHLLNRCLTHSQKSASQHFKSNTFTAYTDLCTIQNCHICSS